MGQTNYSLVAVVLFSWVHFLLYHKVAGYGKCNLQLQNHDLCLL
jgi:hypothetical protein